MTDNSKVYQDRRKRGDRRSGRDRRSGEDRRSSEDRRSGKDRRTGWEQIKDQRLQGVLRTTETVSHVFSQPLTVIMGYVDLLSSSTEEEGTKEKLAIIKEQLELISKYLQNLRNLREYKTVDFAGVTLLDLEKPKQEDPE
jgi:signal transduction histidine kinase